MTFSLNLGFSCFARLLDINLLFEKNFLVEIFKYYLYDDFIGLLIYFMYLFQINHFHFHFKWKS
jgi:hypothetical protein